MINETDFAADINSGKPFAELFPPMAGTIDNHFPLAIDKTSLVIIAHEGQSFRETCSDHISRLNDQFSCFIDVSPQIPFLYCSEPLGKIFGAVESRLNY